MSCFIGFQMENQKGYYTVMLRIDINFEKEIINVLIIVSNFVNHSLVVNELNVFFQSHVILT